MKFSILFLDGRPSSDYPPPRYSEVPERDYSDNRPNNSFSNKGMDYYFFYALFINVKCNKNIKLSI